MKIPVSVLIVTRNEEKNIAACLEALPDFDEIIVVDSASRDRTAEIAAKYGVKVHDFNWNGQYPKKRQWCLDKLNLKHDRVFFVDADEIVTSSLAAEMKRIFASPCDCAGYFVRASHVLNGRVLRHGLQNNKLAVFDRRKMEFPVVDDLDIPGMGEIEGHYQPVLKAGFETAKTGQLRAAILHRSMEDGRAWTFRHQKYARWEHGMQRKNAWPDDPKPFRNMIKSRLRKSRFRPQIMFVLSYILLGGFLDGKEGLNYARNKREYYKLIAGFQ